MRAGARAAHDPDRAGSRDGSIHTGPLATVCGRPLAFRDSMPATAGVEALHAFPERESGRESDDTDPEPMSWHELNRASCVVPGHTDRDETSRWSRPSWR